MISAVVEFKDGKIITHDSNVESTDRVFSSGFISCSYRNDTLSIKRTQLPEIHEPFASLETIKVFEACKSFFKDDIHEKVNKLGFIHKLGVLLYGKQGTGKTSLMNFIASEMVKNIDAICFLCNSEDELLASIGVAKEIRKIQNNPIIFICDEFERFAKDAESEMKNLLDGKDSIDNTLFFASTNYIENVPDTIKDRPSRFRMVVEIKGIEDVDVVKDILTRSSNKVSPSLFSNEEIDNIANELIPCTLDEIKSKVLEKVSSFTPIIQSNKKQIGLTSNNNSSPIDELKKALSPTKHFEWGVWGNEKVKLKKKHDSTI